MTRSQLQQGWVCLSLFVVGVALPMPAATGTGGESDSMDSREVLVTVGDVPITAGDVEFYLITRRVPPPQRRMYRDRYVQQLIERQLVREFLAERKIRADELQVDESVARIQRLIRQAGDDPQAVLERLGYDNDRLRQELALPLAWGNYVRSVVTPAMLREYYSDHRAELDGTQLRARQILIKLPQDADPQVVDDAAHKLQEIRQGIIDGKHSFAEAARIHSDAPSAADGGDLGFFAYRGTMPMALTRVAFGLEAKAISEPFRTPFGMHILTVTDRKPGDLSLEDVRPLVLQQISQQLWTKTIEAQRSAVTIEWNSKPSAAAP